MAEISAQAVQELREKTGLGLMQCKKALAETQGDLEKAIEFLRKQGAAVAAKRVGKETKEGKVLLGVTDSAMAALEVNCETDFVANADDFKNLGNKVLQVLLDKQPKDLEALKTLPLEGSTVAEVQTAAIQKIGENIIFKRFAVESVGAGEFAETYSHMNGKIGVIIKLGYQGNLADRKALSPLARDLAMQVAATSPIAVDAKDVPAATLEKEREIYRELTLKEGKTGDVVDKIVEGKVNKFFKETCLVNQVFVKDPKTTVDKVVAQAAKSLGLEGLKVLSFHRLQLGA